IYAQVDKIYQLRKLLRQVLKEKQIAELKGEQTFVIREDFTSEDLHFGDVYPSTRLIYKANGSKLDTSVLEEPYSNRIDIDDEIELSICDGSYVLINRQPSLTKFCMMVKKVIVRKGGF